ncbi:MAG: hypothetical protein LLG00_02565 [Planctomycetaceae bacterium]|nr:hypothetical protein [Planctomycetaceae bacterium]
MSVTMFHLHDTTRRRLCIGGFVLLGVLPALLVGGWCVSRHLPGRVEAEARELAASLRLDVKLSAVRYLRPGVVLYEGVELAEPETHRRLLRCRLLEICSKRETDPQGQTQPTLSVVASQPEIEASAIPRAWRWLQLLLSSELGRVETDVQLCASELTLHAADGSQTLTDAQGLIECLQDGTHAQFNFRLAGVNTPEPARIRLVRNRQVSPPASGFELYTGGGELPCNVLAMALGELKPLGPRCRFRGYIWANETTDGWEGEMTGQLVGLDLTTLVNDRFPHRMSGIGELTVQSARFRHGRLEEGSAILVAGPGTVDRALLAAAVERLGLRPAANLLPSHNSLREAAGQERTINDRLRYKQLAIAATLDAQGLRVRGRCAGVGPGTILSDGRRPLLAESDSPQTVAALVQTLVPQSAVQVPASRQTDWLLRHLPVPDVIPPAGSEALPVARPRLPDRWQR